MSGIRVGLIGCGHISAAHLSAWKRIPGARISGVLDLNAKLARERARQFGVGTVFDSTEALIEQSDVVDVCTPPHTHAAIAGDVLEAGRHLLIEKPVVTRAEDWPRLRELAETRQLAIGVVHNLKFSHSVQVAKRWIDEGRIGSVIGFTREFMTSPDRDRMLVANSHWSHDLPGGRWFETLPHELYLTHYLLGPLEPDAVTVVASDAAPAGAPADEVAITLRGQRAIATIRYSAHCDQNKRFATVHGSRGDVLIDILGDAVSISTVRERRQTRPIGVAFMRMGRALTRMPADRLGYLARRLRGETPHNRMIRVFAEHLLHGGPTPTPLDEIEYVVQNAEEVGRRIDAAIGRRAAAVASAGG